MCDQSKGRAAKCTLFGACSSAGAEGLCRSHDPSFVERSRNQGRGGRNCRSKGLQERSGQATWSQRAEVKGMVVNTIHIFSVVFILTVCLLLFECFWSGCLGSCHLSSCPTSEPTCRARDKCIDHSHKSVIPPQKVLQASSTLFCSWQQGRNNLWVRP